MSILEKLKIKDKKVLTVAFTIIAVTITSFTAGAVCVSTGILSIESISGRFSNSQESNSAYIEKATQVIENIQPDSINPTEEDTTHKKRLIESTEPVSPTEPTESATVYATDIALDKDFYTMTSKGELLKLNTEIEPKEIVTDTALEWTSSDEKVATVNDGLVTAVADGTATITCTTVNGITAECEIVVEPKIKAEELTLDYIGYDFDGPQYESVLLTPTILPADTTNQNVKWISTNENIALVDELGYVTIVGDGQCEIICTTTDGTYLSATCEINATNTMPIVTHTVTETVYVPVNPQVANSVLEEAVRYVGRIPYVWGGTDLSSGVDCSGFICAIYDRFGINLWGVRTDLYLAGAEVPSIEEAKAGDILCYPGHVAIYDGNGGRIHAYDEGYMVMHDYNIDGYYTIRRIME